MFKVADYFALFYFGRKIEVGMYLVTAIYVLVFLTFVFVRQIQQHIRAATLHLVYEVLACMPITAVVRKAELEPFGYQAAVNARAEVQIYVIVGTCVVLVVEYVRPLLYCFVLHARLLNIYL